MRRCWCTLFIPPLSIARLDSRPTLKATVSPRSNWATCSIPCSSKRIKPEDDGSVHLMTSSSRRAFLQILGMGTAAGIALEPPAASATEPQHSGGEASIIRLDNNENAYGPSEKVVEAIRRAISESNRYPDPYYAELVARIARLHHVGEEQVVLGAGSTEILRIASCTFLEKEKPLVQAVPTYPAIESYARATGAAVISDPLNDRFQHDLNA